MPAAMRGVVCAPANRLVIEETSTDYQITFTAEVVVRQFLTRQWLSGDQESTVFTTNEGREQFILTVYPNGVSSNYSGCVSAYLSLVSSTRNFSQQGLRVSALIIISSHDLTLTVSRWIWRELYVGQSRGFPNLASRHLVCDPANRMLDNDTVTVHVSGSYTTSRQHEVISLPSNNTAMNTLSTVDIRFTWLVCNWTKLSDNDRLISDSFPRAPHFAVFILDLRSTNSNSSMLSMHSILLSMHENMSFPLHVTATISLLQSSSEQPVSVSTKSLMYTQSWSAWGLKNVFSYTNIDNSLFNQCATFRFQAIYSLRY